MSLDPDPHVHRVVANEPTVPVVQAAPVVQPVVQPVVEPVVQPVVQPVVVQQPLQPVARRRVATSWGLWHAWDSVVVGIVGVILLLFGLIAFVRAGTDGPWDQPVVHVAGFTHTAILGIVEMAFGVCLLLSAVSLSRGAATFFGALLAIGGFVGAVQTESFRHSLALESSFAWWMVIAGLVVVIVSAIVPRVFVTRTTTATYVDRY
jgi:hypothetical protein